MSKIIIQGHMVDPTLIYRISPIYGLRSPTDTLITRDDLVSFDILFINSPKNPLKVYVYGRLVALQLGLEDKPTYQGEDASKIIEAMEILIKDLYSRITKVWNQSINPISSYELNYSLINQNNNGKEN